MSSFEFLKRLAALLSAAVIIALALRLIGGPLAFALYGPALALVLTLPFVHRLLVNRLAETRRSRRWALLYTLPVGIAALLQIGFWLAYFHGSATLAVELGVLRHYMQEFHVAAWLAGILAVGLAVLTTRLVEEAGGE